MVISSAFWADWNGLVRYCERGVGGLWLEGTYLGLESKLMLDGLRAFSRESRAFS